MARAVTTPTGVTMSTEALGNALLVAPVLHAGATERTLPALPAGNWYYCWDDHRIESNAPATIAAPLALAQVVCLHRRAVVAGPVHRLLFMGQMQAAQGVSHSSSMW
ncbi:MAG: hypothetical protein HC876_06570 [Chloroflexaceae bacterium]|nr:hypothetical protein [Chloroflexaceae bacterium]